MVIKKKNPKEIQAIKGTWNKFPTITKIFAFKCNASESQKLRQKIRIYQN